MFSSLGVKRTFQSGKEELEARKRLIGVEK